MYKPEQVLSVPDGLEAGPTDLYLSASELQPTESLPLEFSDDLDVVGDGMQCPPSPLLFDPSLALEDHSIKEMAGGPADILASVQSQPSFSHVETELGRGLPAGWREGGVLTSRP